MGFVVARRRVGGVRVLMGVDGYLLHSRFARL